jgi:hypothetical protein
MFRVRWGPSSGRLIGIAGGNSSSPLKVVAKNGMVEVNCALCGDVGPLTWGRYTAIAIRRSMRHVRDVHDVPGGVNQVRRRSPPGGLLAKSVFAVGLGLHCEVGQPLVARLYS